MNVSQFQKEEDISHVKSHLSESIFRKMTMKEGEEHPEGSTEWTAEKNRLKAEFETAFLDAHS